MNENQKEKKKKKGLKIKFNTLKVECETQVPVVPPPGGSLEITPGKRKQRKSKPNL